MNHQPFENWLLDEEPLTAQQQRDLQSHLRDCTICSGLADSNLALHTARMLAPASGFTERFGPRLAAWQRKQLRRQAIGTIILVLIGVGLLYALAGPAMLEALRSPAAWLGDVTVYAVELFAFVSILGQVGGILLRQVPAIISPGTWWALVMAGTLLGIMWIIAMRRLARAPQGVVR